MREMRPETKARLLLAALMIAMVLLFWDRGKVEGQSSISGGTIINSGSTTNPNPPRFSCPNDGVTGTVQNVPVKLSASDTCIEISGTEATSNMAFLGICVSGCGIGGTSQIATSNPIVNCLFNNNTTFGHRVTITSTGGIACNDTGSNAVYSSSVPYSDWGLLLETGNAGVHPIMLQVTQNPMLGGTFINGVSRLDASAFSGQFLFRPNAANNTVCLQLGASGNNAAAALFVANNGSPLLRVVMAGTNCTQGDGGTSGAATLLAAHLGSDAASAPTIASGFGTNNQILSGGDLAFTANIGGGGTATNGVVTFASAFTAAPACMAQDLTSNVATRVTATTATNLTVTAAAAWTANDHIMVMCLAQNGL